MKPKHRGGYSRRHTKLCERTLLTLLRGLGPWKRGIYLAGGLVPHFLFEDLVYPGTTDVDLVLDLEILADVEAYRTLERNLRDLGFARGENDEGRAQHFRWSRQVEPGSTIVLDLMCPSAAEEPAERVAPLTGERRLSAIRIPGAHLVFRDYVEHELSGELLDDHGVATELIRISNLVPFLVLKALAYDDRFEEKDAFDLIFTLLHAPGGPEGVARSFRQRCAEWTEEPLMERALEILRDRFSSADPAVPAWRKDGPVSYARFLTLPGQPRLNRVNREEAASAVALFLAALER